MNAPIDVSNIKIDTERLVLRPWCQNDLSDLYEYAKVDGVGEMAGWCHHKSEEESRKILDMFIEQRKTFAIEFKSSGKVIGSLGLEVLDPDPMDGDLLGREIGYVLSKDYWGRGLMTEAVQAVIGYCFSTLNFDYLTCGHFIQNDRSRRVIEKCGFRYFGESRYETRYDTVETSRNYLILNPSKGR